MLSYIARASRTEARSLALGFRNKLNNFAHVHSDLQNDFAFQMMLIIQ